MIIIYVLTILNAITCLATSIDSNPARKFTLDNVKMLVKAFMTYRDTPGSLEFAAAMGDPERLKLAGATRRDNYLPLYLSLNSDLFDTVRKMYKVCNMEGLELQKSMISPALKSVYQSVDILGLCLPYTPDFEETEMGLVNILNEIGRRKGIIDANGRLNDSVHIMSCFLDRYHVDSSWPCQNKKYLWAMIRFDLLTNNPEGRAKLIESFGHKLSLQNLIELNSFARKHGIVNTLFDIDEMIYKEGKDNSTTTTSNASISTTDNSSGSEENMCKKAMDLAKFYKMLGANGYIMGERTVLCIYKTFIRSVMEYGLQIMPLRQKLLTKLESTQNYCLTLMLSLFHNANKCSVRMFYHLQSMAHRHEELSTRWALRLSRKRKPNFLTTYAAEQARKRPLSKSSFSFIHGTENRLLEICRKDLMEDNRFWSIMYPPIQLFYRPMRLEEDRVRASVPNAILVNKNCRPIVAFEIGQMETTTRRLLTLYILGKITVSEPKPCKNCQESSATIKHAFWCSGTRPPDYLILRRSYRMARERITRAMYICMHEYAYYKKSLDL